MPYPLRFFLIDHRIYRLFSKSNWRPNSFVLFIQCNLYILAFPTSQITHIANYFPFMFFSYCILQHSSFKRLFQSFNLNEIFLKEITSEIHKGKYIVSFGVDQHILIAEGLLPNLCCLYYCCRSNE